VAIPLVLRHLYTLRNLGWRQALVLCHPDQRAQLEAAVGDPRKLGAHVCYLEIDGQEGVPLPELIVLDENLLVIESHYLVEERILSALADQSHPALAYDRSPLWPEGLSVVVHDGQVVAVRDAGGDGLYTGALFLPRQALARLAGARLPLDETARLQWLASELELATLEVDQLDPYVVEVRRQARPFWSRVASQREAEQCREALLEEAQKRTLDVVAWYVNRPLENWITRRIADWPITPNQMSGVVSLIAFAATGLFLGGWLLPASLLTLVVNVLDGVDGKLARVKGLATKLGQLEHSFDQLYEQSWYIAFTWATHLRRGDLWPLVLGFWMLLFDTFTRHASMQFRQVMGVSLADYAPFDRLFRRFDGRRNIYTYYMLLGILVGRPFYALATMALHASVTGAVYAVRAACHLHAADLGQSH
jgi:phosphatidylglycerophosphate synthase